MSKISVKNQAYRGQKFAPSVKRGAQSKLQKKYVIFLW
jgi:hypothetical protein